MNNSKIKEALNHHGYYCEIDNQGILHIAEGETIDRTTGIAFTASYSENRLRIFLYSARCYECICGQNPHEILLDILSGKYTDSGKIPYTLPESLVNKYDLHEGWG